MQLAEQQGGGGASSSSSSPFSSSSKEENGFIGISAKIIRSEVSKANNSFKASLTSYSNEVISTVVVRHNSIKASLTTTTNEVGANFNLISQFVPAQARACCRAGAQMELALAMSELYHEKGGKVVKPVADDTGSKHIQVLRSCGKWSMGTQTECSIMNAWISAINAAESLIYIENQFFVSDMAGNDVQNGIAKAICNRILLAHAQRKPLRVIITIPMHPNGDYIHAMKARVVLHYQASTIKKCKTSLYQALKRQAPDINPDEYLGFFSLRNWGVLNNKVYLEQIYVHDKLIIVDDRVLIIGSANVNDRSMLGSRDTEMALRMEDSNLLQVSMGGVSFNVGRLPHETRVKLMRQHLADPNADIVDILNKTTYMEQWRDVSAKNSAIYDEIDGNISPYRTHTLAQFEAAMLQYTPKSALDPMTMHSLEEIKGFIVDYPTDLLGMEDISPSLAVRAIISNDLWV